jgi:hypothetical protein
MTCSVRMPRIDVACSMLVTGVPGLKAAELARRRSLAARTGSRSSTGANSASPTSSSRSASRRISAATAGIVGRFSAWARSRGSALLILVTLTVVPRGAHFPGSGKHVTASSVDPRSAVS